MPATLTLVENVTDDAASGAGASVDAGAATDASSRLDPASWVHSTWTRRGTARPGTGRPGTAQRGRALRRPRAPEPRLRAGRVLVDDRGAVTAEYALVIMAGVAFAGLLVAIMRSGEIRQMLVDLVQGALGSAG